MKRDEVRPRFQAWSLRQINGYLLEMTFGVSWLLVGVAWLTQGEDIAARSPIGHVVPVASAIWNGAFVLAGVLILFGVVRRRELPIVVGLSVQTAGLLMAGSAAAAFDLEPRIGVYFVQAAACATRVVWIAKRGLPD